MGFGKNADLRADRSTPPRRSGILDPFLRTSQTIIHNPPQSQQQPKIIPIQTDLPHENGASNRSRRMGSIPTQAEVMIRKSSEANLNQVSIDKESDVTVDEYSESSQVVVGLCPDMCPESEREERERKKDLDKYERLNGKRNETCKLIAVKKYTRTAEREASLIRPMPVLQNTIDYLMQLLDRPYDDNLLGIYNFLWDRMRAIRVDLRVQRILNHEAVMMLEKMIRLHIVAMHELCEYKKKEGLLEWFDQHLNIEQMNKMSVELFEMYNDYQKRGSSVETEKEFRGYYTLLKLDKHPGYRVEPAELSHDLAQMSPGIRCTPELMFARDAQRAYKTGNYISFFRLAKRATYLQGCLMHAHFAKVRRLALASLHKGLQRNSGIPIPDVAKWLGMENEDIKSLIEYHGFVVKTFDDMYMVKEGPFLNVDTDFATKCSKILWSKKSGRIFDDVCSVQTISEAKIRPPLISDGVVKEVELLEDAQSRTNTSTLVVCIHQNDEGMLHSKDEHIFGVEPPPISEVVAKENKLDVGFGTPPEQLFEEPSAATLSRENELDVDFGTPPEQLVEEPSAATLSRENPDDITNTSAFELNCACLNDSCMIHTHQVDEERKSILNGDVFINEETLAKLEERIPENSSSEDTIQNSIPLAAVDRTQDKRLLVFRRNRVEAINENLIREWKQRSSNLKLTLKQSKILGAAAPSSLPLVPSASQNIVPRKRANEELNIDIHRQMFSYSNHATNSLSNVDASEVSLDQCISEFNDALDHLAEEVILSRKLPRSLKCLKPAALPQQFTSDEKVRVTDGS